MQLRTSFSWALSDEDERRYNSYCKIYTLISNHKHIAVYMLYFMIKLWIMDKKDTSLKGYRNGWKVKKQESFKQL